MAKNKQEMFGRSVVCLSLLNKTEKKPHVESLCFQGSSNELGGHVCARVGECSMGNILCV